MTIEPLRAEPIQEPSDGLRASDRNDGDPLGIEIAAAALGERLQRVLVADPFDEHDRTRVGAWGQGMRGVVMHASYLHGIQISAT